MSSYNCLAEYGFTSDQTPDVITINPSWVIAIYRLRFPNLFSRRLGKSFSTNHSDAVALRGEALIIDNDCIHLSTSSNKGNHIITMSATLMASSLNYLSEIYAEDYMFAWMFNNSDDAERIKLGIKDGTPCNSFMDGLKFIGKVTTIQKCCNQQSDGIRTVRYTLTGTGFGELDSSIFYDPSLAQATPQLGEAFLRLGIPLNELINRNSGGIDVNLAIPFFFDLLFGRGVPPDEGRSNVREELRSTAGTFLSIYPREVGYLLDKTNSYNDLLAFADISEIVYGVQNYDSTDLDSTENLLAGDYFNPIGTESNGSKRRASGDLMGRILPVVPQFTGKTAWSIIHGLINPIVNEMYMTLRCNIEGHIVPTIVVRQMPFSTPNAALNTDLNVTPFLELPRWKIASSMVKSYAIGRSGSLGVNFIHIQGNTAQPASTTEQHDQLIFNPPIRNDLDISRSGLKPNMGLVDCDAQDILDHGPKKWMALVADYQMAQKFTLTGSIEIIGIQAPICVGDNMEWDGAVYHIEQVSHSCGISSGGHKTFSTSLGLTNGVSGVPANDDDQMLGVYACVNSEDLRTFDPGLSTDTPDTSSAPLSSGGSSK